jgi:hypothetical protein
VTEEYVAIPLDGGTHVFDRFPRLRVIICHCGGSLDRRIKTVSGRGSTRSRRHPRRRAELFDRKRRLPIIDRERFVYGFPRAELERRIATPGPVLPQGFVFQAGQPEEVREAYRQAMGLDVERARDARSHAG